MKNQLKYSVIICTFGREQILQNCLRSLSVQSFDNQRFEIIVVDNNCSDNSVRIIKNYTGNYPHIKHIKEKKQGLSYARNKGCQKARGKYLIYLDDDVVVPPGYIQAIDTIVNTYKPDMLGGPLYPYYTSKKPFWFNNNYEIRKYEEVSGFSDRCNISGGNFLILKKILFKLGMFDPEYGMKGKKLGACEERKILETYRCYFPKNQQKVYYALEAYVYHHVPDFKFNLFYFWKRNYIAGKNLAKIHKEFRTSKLLPKSENNLKFENNLSDLFFEPINIIRKQGIFDTDFIYLSGRILWRIGYNL